MGEYKFLICWLNFVWNSLRGEAEREGWARSTVKQICNLGSVIANLIDRPRFKPVFILSNSIYGINRSIWSGGCDGPTFLILKKEIKLKAFHLQFGGYLLFVRFFNMDWKENWVLSVGMSKIFSLLPLTDENFWRNPELKTLFVSKCLPCASKNLIQIVSWSYPRLAPPPKLNLRVPGW